VAASAPAATAAAPSFLALFLSLAFLAAALVLRALCGLEGRSAAPLSQLVRDSVSAPAADDLMQGELGL
jgi:hypothetical protein